jgi:hypothetical protein
LHSGERIYLWIVLVAMGLPALFRCTLARRYAEMQSEKLSSPRAQRNQRILGWVSLLGSPLILVYGFFVHMYAWIWPSAIAGVIGGADSLAAVWFVRRGRLLAHTVLFGVIGAAAAAWIYFTYLRH